MFSLKLGGWCWWAGGVEGQDSQQMARESERDTQWQNKRVRNSWWAHGQEMQGTNGHQNKPKSGRSECRAGSWRLEFIHTGCSWHAYKMDHGPRPRFLHPNAVFKITFHLRPCAYSLLFKRWTLREQMFPSFGILFKGSHFATKFLWIIVSVIHFLICMKAFRWSNVDRVPDVEIFSNGNTSGIEQVKMVIWVN